MKIATIASITVASIIVLIKFFAWVKTDSLVILSSLIDSMLDVATSTINFVAVRYALQPPDKEHRFGHGKAEDIAALAQTIFIVGSGLFIVVEAVSRFFNLHPIQQEETGIIIMVISMVMTLGLVIFQKYVVHKTKSGVITADSYHYITDILANLLIIISLFASQKYGFMWIDPLLALIVAGYIFAGAWKISVRAFQNLMDREFDEKDRERIKNIVLAHPDVKGVHDLRTRAAGLRSFIQMHLELDGKITLNKAHEIADGLEQQIAKEFPHAEVMIHQDPAENYVRKSK